MRKLRQNWVKFNQVSNLASEDVFFFIDKYMYKYYNLCYAGLYGNLEISSSQITDERWTFTKSKKTNLFFL